MDVLTYDGSFKGFLTAIFEVYEYRLRDVSVCRDGYAHPGLFGAVRNVSTDDEKSARVMKKLKEKISPAAVAQFYKTFLSELPAVENSLLRYVRYVLSEAKSVEHNYAHPDVLFLQQTSRRVHREKHRMEAFVRFQRTKDDLYYSIIQPDFNVLPLISKHFKERYADQRWLIYDSLRKYGLYYDLQHVTEIELHFDVDRNSKEEMMVIENEEEELYRQLWRQYFTSVNIPARKNMKLHIRHMPKRYWRYLTEKNG